MRFVDESFRFYRRSETDEPDDDRPADRSSAVVAIASPIFEWQVSSPQVTTAMDTSIQTPQDELDPELATSLPVVSDFNVVNDKSKTVNRRPHRTSLGSPPSGGAVGMPPFVATVFEPQDMYDDKDHDMDHEQARPAQLLDDPPTTMKLAETRHVVLQDPDADDARVHRGRRSFSSGEHGSRSDPHSPFETTAWSNQTSAKRAILEDYEVYRLMRHYVEVLGPWLDLTDSKRHYSTVVPQLALKCPVLMNAILAFSARHLHRLESRKAVIAEYYHNEAIKVMIPMLQDQAVANDSTLLATTIILRMYETLERE